MKISERAKHIKASATLSISKKAKAMIKNGIDVINFGVGEPDFCTPQYIKNAGIKAINDNYTRYTESAGIPELRQAIADKLKRENNLNYEKENILVSSGAKHSILNILLTICDYQDEVIIPMPYWVSYTAQIEMVNAKPVILPTNENNNFEISPEQLDKTITSKTTALIINSPNNPTGTVYTQQRLEDIAEVAKKHKIYVISDEIYERLVYDDVKHFSIACCDGMENLAIVINGVSKAFAMTGWRIGYAAAPMEIIKKAIQFQSHSTSCANSIAQKAAEIALSKEDNSVEKMRVEFEKRRNYLIKALNNIPNVYCNMTKGAFYAMPNISYYLKLNSKIKNSVDLCSYLLDKYKVALVPGIAFGVDNYVRFSYANSMENIKKGVERFADGLANLHKSKII